MSELGETLSGHGTLRQLRRKHFGVNCPGCKIARPKAHPTILLPGQRCKVDGYRDTRPELNYMEECKAYGIKPVPGSYGYVEVEESKG